MWLSPDCKHFSKAKGGKPVSPRVRGLAWVAVRWAKAVQPRIIVLENVEEFQTWGPVDRETNRPCPRRRGVTFKRFVGRLRSLGYVVEWRELRACDYGAPTIRKRLFLIARRDGQPIVWPIPTHGKGRAQPWRTAAECIDFALPCPSIFTRKKPLAENTLKRIGAGLRRFVFECDRPFIIPIDNGSNGAAGASSSRAPLSTITAEARHAVVMPHLVTYHGAKHDGDDRTDDLTQPLPVQDASNRYGLVAPLLVPRYGEREGQAPRAQSVEKPLSTIVPTQNGGSLVAGFLARHYSERKPGEVQGVSLFGPAPTVTTIDHNALVTSHLEVMHGNSEGRAVGEPAPTLLGCNHLAEVRAFLVAYYGTQQNTGSLFEPLATVTSKDRLGLVTVEGQDYKLADVGMRMLAPRELYRAQGFPDSYKIDIPFTDPDTGKTAPMTKTAQVRMCGNSVCPDVAAAIIRANVQRVSAEERAA
jgi:DNA (cytosine-5)-methyltransferase 1